MKKQKADILAFKRDESLKIPSDISTIIFQGFPMKLSLNLSKLTKNYGQALRIDGITPAAVFILLSHLKESLLSIA